MQWISYFENLYKNELSEKEKTILRPRSEVLQSMVRQGIPHSLRPQLWMRFSGRISIFIVFNSFKFIL